MRETLLVSAIIPAFDEEKRIERTLSALQQVKEVDEIIVVDDGSRDQTARKAEFLADRVIRLPQNGGKGVALTKGLEVAAGDVFLFVDADLEGYARLCGALVGPVLKEDVDMTIASFPAARKKGGFGLVKKLARYGVRRLTGTTVEAVLSGQRAVTRELMESLGVVSGGFGMEVGMTVGALRKGYTLQEIPLPLSHRETGRDWRGFVHRGKQFAAILGTLIRLWRQPA
ncbi:glycosyltransferase involved in cell wall biosynthesis [Kroppenstedtia sanguinis]|uniref:Glucosyl-3-phosphoglycerate synthase n=1 Tax=Kroppenstedtia sanguinis TaxID=1380684 RepID=A0ABW4CES6_9BACL